MASLAAAGRSLSQRRASFRSAIASSKYMILPLKEMLDGRRRPFAVAVLGG